MERGTGRTTAQIKAAPPNAIFVWCNGLLSYPKDLARSLGRTDLHIVSPEWAFGFGGNRLRGMHRKVVVDHAYAPDGATSRGFREAIERGLMEIA